MALIMRARQGNIHISVLLCGEKQRITKTGLRNGISHESEAVNKHIYQACFAEKNKGAHDKYNSKAELRTCRQSLESMKNREATDHQNRAKNR